MLYYLYKHLNVLQNFVFSIQERGFDTRAINNRPYIFNLKQRTFLVQNKSGFATLAIANRPYIKFQFYTFNCCISAFSYFLLFLGSPKAATPTTKNLIFPIQQESGFALLYNLKQCTFLEYKRQSILNHCMVKYTLFL